MRVHVAGCVVAAVALVLACGNRSQTSLSEASGDARVTRRSHSGWSPPVNLGTPINSIDDEFHPAISSDGLTFYFAGHRTHDVLPSACVDPTSNPPPNYGGNDLYFSTRPCPDDSCPWSSPMNMGPTVNAAGDESGPFPSASADGSFLYVYFASANRIGGQGATDIWRARRGVNDPCWNDLVNLGATINTAANEADPALVTLNGNTYLFFARGTPFQIYVSRVDVSQLDGDDPSGAFGQPKPVSVSVPTFNSTHPAIFGETMVFASNRPGTCSSTNAACTADASCPAGETCNLSQGGPDLWMATLSPDDADGTQWSTPVNLGPDVNSSSIDRAPFAWVDPTGDLFLYFASTRPGGLSGLGDFYVMRARAASRLLEP